MRLAGNRAQHAVFAAATPRCQCPACKSQTGKKLFPTSIHAQSNLLISTLGKGTLRHQTPCTYRIAAML